MKKFTTIFIFALMSLSLFMGCSKKDNVIHMATKPITEQYILGNIMKTLIEAKTDLTVEVAQGVGGGTLNIHPAMLKGEFDFYPEYTGTVWHNVLKKEGRYEETLIDELAKSYDEMGIKWMGYLGYGNPYDVGVQKAVAEKYNLKNMSDLEAVADKLVFGANYDFYERPDGFPAIEKAYNVHFKDKLDVEMGLKYDLIREKKADVLICLRTDGQIADTNLVILKDDKNLFESMLAGFVVRKEVLEAHPELVPVFDSVLGKFTDDEVRAMNYKVEIEKAAPEDVAVEFLKAKGLI